MTEPTGAITTRGSRQALGYALAAAVVSLVLWNVPIANLVLYPLRILVTLIHEGGHALATVVTGGAVQGMAVNPDGSGVTYSAGGWGILIAPAGYLGAAAFGAVLLWLLQGSRAGRRALYLTAGVAAVITVLFVRNLFGLGAGLGLTLALAAAARYLPPLAALFLSAFLAVQFILNAFLDLINRTFSSGFFAIGHNDAVLMARLITLPPIVWALLWAILAALLVVWLARALWRGATR